MFTEDITAVVLDPGSLTFRAGYSGEDTPKRIESVYAGINNVPKSVPPVAVEGGAAPAGGEESKMEQEILEKKYYVGEQSIAFARDGMEIVPAYHKGEIRDEKAFVDLLTHTYKQLGVQPQNYALLLSEPSIPHPKQREKLCQIAFEQLKVPNLYIIKSGVLSAFSTGRSNALILDSGAYQTYAVPVFDGYALTKSAVRYDIGGEFLTDLITDYVERTDKKSLVSNQERRAPQGIALTESYRKYFRAQCARDIKETVCRVEEKSLPMGEYALDRMDYHLPDGTQLHFDRARTEYCEYFFSRQSRIDQNTTPEQLNSPDLLSYKGVHQMALDAINQSDIDFKKELFQNIILCGGNSLLSGFSTRLSAKLADIVPSNIKVKMIAYPSAVERKYSSWIGGSIVASLGSFQSMWITKAEYEESGETIVDKKCP